jgi:hypothetical protein
MDLNKVPVPHPQVAARTVDESAVIVLADSGEVTVLNAVGTRVWELVDGSRSVGEIIQIVESEYEAAAEQVHADVVGFIESLAEAGAITLEERPQSSK